MHEWRSHTAEIELYIEAPTQEEVYVEAALAFGRLVEREPAGEATTHEFELEARDRPALLVDLLDELIYLADTEAFVTDHAAVEVGETLRIRLDGRRTEVEPLVKAATYHGVEFAHRGEAWQARVVLDV